MNSYGQYCPIARAAEVLDQRWTLLVIRELVSGSDRFNDIHRGVPRNRLTDAGQELQPVLERLGEWGMRWLDSLTADELDPASLLWDVQRRVDGHALPDGRTVLALTFTDIEPELRDWWLLMTPQEVDVCIDDPGHPTDVALETPIRTFVAVWRGDISWRQALRSRDMTIRGPEHLRRQLPEWFQLSYFASVSR